LWGGQFCPQPAFSRLYPLVQAFGAKVAHGKAPLFMPGIPVFSMRGCLFLQLRGIAGELVGIALPAGGRT
jgi:hypothetical protein